LTTLQPFQTYIIGAPKTINGSLDLTMPFSGMVCRPMASTCCDQSAY